MALSGRVRRDCTADMARCESHIAEPRRGSTPCSARSPSASSRGGGSHRCRFLSGRFAIGPATGQSDYRTQSGSDLLATCFCGGRAYVKCWARYLIISKMVTSSLRKTFMSLSSARISLREQSKTMRRISGEQIDGRGASGDGPGSDYRE